MDRFEAMSILLAVVEHGSISAAGRALRAPVPTLSRKIAELERHLGVSLLTRTTRRLSLTDAGTAYLAAARRIIEQVEEAERLAVGEHITPKGELIVAAPLFFGRIHVLPIIVAFLEQYPDISVRLLQSDQLSRMSEEHVDLAIRIGLLPDSALVATKVGDMRSLLCASPALLGRFGVPQTLDALDKMPGIAIDAVMPAVSGLQPARDAVVAMVPRLTVSTAESALDAAQAGIGVVRLLHYQVAEALQAGRLVRLLEAHEPDAVPVHLVHIGRNAMPLKLRCFIDFATPRLRQALLDLAS